MKTYLTIFLLVLFVSINHAQWTAQSSGVNISLRGVYFLNANDGWVVGASGTFLKTTNGGVTWVKKTIGGGSGLIAAWMIDANNGFVSGDYLYRTTDGGESWNEVFGFPDLTCLWFFDSQNGFAAGGTDYNHTANIYKTTDGGINWTNVLHTTDMARIYGLQFIGRNIGYVHDENDNFYKTTDGGNTWLKQNVGISPYKIIAMRFIDQNTGVLGGRSDNNGFTLRTTNGGSTFEGASTPLTYMLSEIYFSNSTTGWAAGGNPTSSSLYKTTDAGLTWSLTQATGTIPWSHMFFLDENHGWIVSEAGDIYAYNGATAVKDGQGEIPSSFTVDQNYPNPFNPSTSVRFNLPYQSNVKLEVYSITGELVSSINNGVMSSGSHEMKINADNLSSGIYLYRISAVSTDGKNIFQASKKMTLLK